MFLQRMWSGVSPGQESVHKRGRSRRQFPPCPDLNSKLREYAGKVRALSILLACLRRAVAGPGIAGLGFANAFLSGISALDDGPWAHGSMLPNGSDRRSCALRGSSVVIRSAWPW